MAEVATLATSTTRPKRRYTRVTPALHARIVKLKARGLTHEEIAHRVGICEATVSRVLSKPLTRAEISDFATRLGVDRQQLREALKDFLAEHLQHLLLGAIDLIDQKIAERDARGFMHAATALERLDRLSGRTVDEGRRVIHDSRPQQPAVDFKTLLGQILDKHPDARVVSASG
jgi:predicted transcriptional regulator